MTRPKENPQRLPQETEIQIKKEALTSVLNQLSEASAMKFFNGTLRFTPNTLFRHNENVFGLSFEHNEDAGRIVRSIDIELQEEGHLMNEDGSIAKVIVVPAYSPADVQILQQENGNFTNLTGELIESVEELDQMITVASFLRDKSVNGLSLDREILSDIPEAIQEIMESVDSTEAMKFEYLKPEFYEVFNRVSSKAIKTDYSKYEPKGNNTAATTGWVQVEKEGQKVELKFDIVGQINNGSYDELGEVYERNLGNDGKGRYLFGETGLWDMGSINNLEKLTECVSILNLLDAALPEPAVSST